MNTTKPCIHVGMELQPSFAHSEDAVKKKVTRRDIFLAEMDAVVPCLLLVGLVEPFHPQGKRGRPPAGIERMLRIYFLQQWYGLADEALEDAIYDSQSMRAFTGIDLGVESVPAAATLLKFRHLLEKHDLTRKIFEQVNALLSEKQLLMRKGTIVDATIIAAAPLTKHKARERDPEMHQTKKGNQYYFGMKAHIGVDADSGLVHTLTATATNVSDVVETRNLLHGGEEAVFADAGYTGVEKREEIVAQHPEVEFHDAEKRGKIKAMPEGKLKDLKKALEKSKAQARASIRAWVFNLRLPRILARCEDRILLIFFYEIMRAPSDVVSSERSSRATSQTQSFSLGLRPRALARNGCRAFSLVEVSIALGVASFAMISIIGLIPTGLATLRESVDGSAAARIVRAVAADARQGAFASIAANTYYFDENQVSTSRANSVFTAQVTVLPGATVPGAAGASAGLKALSVRVAHDPAGVGNLLSQPTGNFPSYVVWVSNSQ